MKNERMCSSLNGGNFSLFLYFNSHTTHALTLDAVVITNRMNIRFHSTTPKQEQSRALAVLLPLLCCCFCLSSITQLLEFFIHSFIHSVISSIMTVDIDPEKPKPFMKIRPFFYLIPHFTDVKQDTKRK